MRIQLSAAVALLLSVPVVATAAMPTVAPAQIGAQLRENFDKDFGPDEVANLQRCMDHSFERAFANSGAIEPGVSIAVTIDEARPSHPTFWQQTRDPSLDPLRSVSLGGAKLKAQLLASDGRVLRTVEHRHYAWDLREVSLSSDPWGDACLAINQLARKVAKAAARL